MNPYRTIKLNIFCFGLSAGLAIGFDSPFWAVLMVANVVAAYFLIKKACGVTTSRVR